MAQPPAKRLRMTLPVGGADEAAAAAAAAAPESPGSRKLWQTLLVVLFLVRVCVRNKVTASLSQIKRMVREEVSRCLDPFFRGYSLLVSKLESTEERIQSLTHKVVLQDQLK